VLVLTSFPRSLGDFIFHLLVAATLVIAANIVVFLFIFRSDLGRRFDPTLIDASPREESGPYFWFVVGSLGAIAVAYVFASTSRWPISFVALGGSVWLLVASLWARRVKWARLASAISWPIFGFIGGMLVMVQGIDNLGLTAGFGRWLVGLSGGQSWGAVLTSVFGAAIGSNAINNVPMSLVLISSIRSATPPGHIQDLFVYGTIIGADLGPNITTVGSLATMLWLLILRRKGLNISSVAYFKLGIVVTPILLALGALALWLMSLLRG
jgi:arsenical pump membrane protein